MTKKRYNVVFYILFLVFFCVAMYFCPHSVDDTYYDYLNISGFKDALHFSAGYGNGRVLGNFLALVMCKSRLFAAVFRSSVVTAIVYYITKFVDEKNVFVTLCTGLSLVGIGGLIFGEVYSWISGFANYLPPILLTLIALNFIKYFEKSNKPLAVIMISLCAAAVPLFNESAALNCAFLSLAVVLYCIFKQKNKFVLALVYFVSECVGVLVMLYARKNVHDKRGIYSTVDYSSKLDSIKSIFANAWEVYQKYVLWFPKFLLLFALISVVGILIVYQSEKSRTRFSNFIGTVLAIYPLFLIFCSASQKADFMAQTKLLYIAVVTVMTFLYLFCVLMLFLYIDEKQRAAYIFSFVFAVFNVGYYLVLYPVNSRATYYTYVVFTVLLAILIKNAKLRFVPKKAVASFLLAGTVAVFAFLIPLQINIYHMDKIQREYIEYQIEQGATNVCVSKLTYTDYYHHSYYDDRLGTVFYKDKPKDVTFQEVPIESWLGYYYNNGNYKINK